MGLICRIVKDCVQTDGIREYLFPFPLDPSLVDDLKDMGRPIELKKNGGLFLKIYREEGFSLSYFKGEAKILVYYENFSDPQIRVELEKKLEQHIQKKIGGMHSDGETG